MPYIILKEKTPAATVTVQGFMTVVNNPVISEVKCSALKRSNTEKHVESSINNSIFGFTGGAAYLQKL